MGKVCFTLIVFIGFSSLCKLYGQSKIKYNKGHYVAVGPYFDLSEINHFESSALRGVNKRYFWRTLEPLEGKYDFSQVEEDLAYCKKYNKQLIVFLCDRAFWKRGAVPNHLKHLEDYTEASGFTPLRWLPEFQERFIDAIQAIGEAFDDHPNFEGVAIQESSLNITEEIVEKYNYEADAYQKALLHILSEADRALPKSRVFWYQNGIQGSNDRLRIIADSISGSKIVMGGPDILPHRRWLRNTYKIYGDYKDQLTLFCSAQDDSYKHHKNDIKYHSDLPIPEEGYLTMEEIFFYARDKMFVDYLFWNYYYEGQESGHRSFDDAIKVVKTYPQF